MHRKIKLYGELATQIGHKQFDDINVSNVAQAVSFLVHNFPEIEAHMATRHYKVIIDHQEINQDELFDPIGRSDISFVPVIEGSGGLGKVLTGAALIGLSLATGGFGGAAIGTFGLGAGSIGLGKLATGIGAALVLGGVSEMLFPLPKPPEFSSEEDPRISFAFSGVQQTSRAGTPVPIVYGEIFTGSVVISGGIDTEQVQA